MTRSIDWELAELEVALFLLEESGQLGRETRKSAREILDSIQSYSRDGQVCVLTSIIEEVVCGEAQ